MASPWWPAASAACGCSSCSGRARPRSRPMPSCAASRCRPARYFPRPLRSPCRPDAVPRYKITVEYDGGPFVGWQRQDTGPSVQAALEDAVFALSGERVLVQGAGRTDSGVHARGQVAHFDMAAEKRVEEVRGALSFHLKPNPIVVIAAE